MAFWISAGRDSELSVSESGVIPILSTSQPDCTVGSTAAACHRDRLTDSESPWL